MRSGIDERGISELIALAEHVSSLCVAAQSLQLPVDIPDLEPERGHLVAPADPESMDGDTTAVMSEIAAWAPNTLGVDHVPLIWRVLAHMPRFTATTWRKHQLVMSAGRFDVEAKACVAFAVACTNRSPYMIALTTAQLRKTLGLGDAAIVELVASVMHYTSSIVISHAMLLEPEQAEQKADRSAEGASPPLS
jgi:hypothetical protein